MPDLSRGFRVLIGHIVPYRVLMVVVVVVVNIKHWCSDGRWWTTGDWKKICHAAMQIVAIRVTLVALTFLAFVVWS